MKQETDDTTKTLVFSNVATSFDLVRLSSG